MDSAVFRNFGISVIKPNADFFNNLTAFGARRRRLAIPDRATLKPFCQAAMARKGGTGERPMWEEIGRLHAPNSAACWTMPRLGGTDTPTPASCRGRPVHERLDAVRDALGRLAQLLDGPVGRIALGHVVGRSVVHQPPGQRMGQK